MSASSVGNVPNLSINSDFDPQVASTVRWTFPQSSAKLIWIWSATKAEVVVEDEMSSSESVDEGDGVRCWPAISLSEGAHSDCFFFVDPILSCSQSLLRWTLGAGDDRGLISTVNPSVLAEHRIVLVLGDTRRPQRWLEIVGDDEQDDVGGF